MFDGFPVLAGDSFTYGSYFGLNGVLGGLAIGVVAVVVGFLDQQLSRRATREDGGDSVKEELGMTIIGDNPGSDGSPTDAQLAVDDKTMDAAVRSGQTVAAWVSFVVGFISVLSVALMMISYTIFWATAIFLALAALALFRLADGRPAGSALPAVAAALRASIPWYASGAVSFAVLQSSMFFYVNSFFAAVCAWVPLAAVRMHQLSETISALSAPTGQRLSFQRLRPILRAEAKSFLGLFLGCWLVSWLTADTCIGFYSPDAPAFFHYNVIAYSTRATRAWTGPSNLCGEDTPQKPCHVYLSAAEAMSSSVFVNVHTALDETQDLTIRFCETANGLWPSPDNAVCPNGQPAGSQKAQRFDANSGCILLCNPRLCLDRYLFVPAWYRVPLPLLMWVL